MEVRARVGVETGPESRPREPWIAELGIFEALHFIIALLRIKILSDLLRVIKLHKRFFDK